MDDHDREIVIERYNQRLQEFGDDPKSLGWFKGRQPLRFAALAEIGDLDGSSILDVGCGFGDLFGFLKGKGIDVEYTGVDINENLIKMAQDKYPEARFYVRDIEAREFDEKFDWVISSGIFNFKLSDNNRFTENMLRKMFDLSNMGISADFMSTHVDFMDDETHYTDPEEIFRYSKTLTKRVTLRHDYLPFEFCVYIYKGDEVEGGRFKY